LLNEPNEIICEDGRIKERNMSSEMVDDDETEMVVDIFHFFISPLDLISLHLPSQNS